MHLAKMKSLSNSLLQKEKKEITESVGTCLLKSDFMFKTMKFRIEMMTLIKKMTKKN